MNTPTQPPQGVMAPAEALAVLTDWRATEEGRCNHLSGPIRCAICLARSRAISTFAALLARCEGLEAAASAVLPYIATRAVGCGGDRCREPWCFSCCGEDEANEAAMKGRDAYAALHALLAATRTTGGQL